MTLIASLQMHLKALGHYLRTRDYTTWLYDSLSGRILFSLRATPEVPYRRRSISYRTAREKSLSRLFNFSNDNCTRGYNVREANRINADVTHTEYIVRDKNLLGMAGGNIAAGPFESARAPSIRVSRAFTCAPSMRLECAAARTHITRPYTCLCALYAIYDLDPCAQRQRNASLFLSLSLFLLFRLLEQIQFRKKAARTNSASAGMVKLRNFSSRSDVSDHSGELGAAFTRILLCCLDTYISRDSLQELDQRKERSR